MFSSKQKSLFEVKKKITSGTGKTEQSVPEGKSSSPFVNAALRKGAETRSGNDALKYSTTGNSFVDQFSKAGKYKAIRPFEDIVKDQELLWAENPRLSVAFILYLRIITRITVFFNGSKTEESQRGAELKNEPIMRMIWLAVKAPKTFEKNLSLFISVGSWKDIFTMLQADLIYNGWDKRVLDWRLLGSFIIAGLENPHTSELIKKYLPQIRAKSACKTVEKQADTLIGKYLCHLLFGNKSNSEEMDESAKNYKAYRKLKVSGTAHTWQQLISQKRMDELDFSKIHGRALSLLVRGKFLFNQKLSEKYKEWAGDAKIKAIKYTGFVHELFGVTAKYHILVRMPEAEQITINKQFQTLIDKGKGNEEFKSGLIVVRDTSGSMAATAPGTKISCYNIAKALALYFSEFLTGFFADSWIEFNRAAQMHRWTGNTPLEKWYNDHSGVVGSTDFQSVIRLLCLVKQQGIKEEEFPTGILCISDGEFNPANGSSTGALSKTNVEYALITLTNAGFSAEYVSNFRIILWNLQNDYYGKGSGEKFETYGGVKNVYYFGGYSASVIAFLTSEVETAEELFNAAMAQEILRLVEL